MCKQLAQGCTRQQAGQDSKVRLPNHSATEHIVAIVVMIQQISCSIRRGSSDASDGVVVVVVVVLVVVVVGGGVAADVNFYHMTL